MINRIVTIVLLLLALHLQGQHTHLTFKSISKGTAFQGASIEQIVQDSEGYMWFGTWAGLARFDGHNLIVYIEQADDSLSIIDNQITSFFEDSQNRLWIGTVSGMCLYSKDNDNFRSSKNSSRAIFSVESQITSIVEDDDGELWMSTINRGVFRYNYEKDVLVEIPVVIHGEPLMDVRNLLVYENEIWLGTQNLVGAISKETLLTEVIYEGMGDDFMVLSSLIAQDKTVWLGTNNGVLKFEGGDKKAVNSVDGFKGLVALSLLEADDGLIWIGVDGAGVGVHDPRSEKSVFYTENSGLPTKNVKRIYKDPEGSVWVGCYLNGFSITNKDINFFHHVKSENSREESINPGTVTSFLIDKNDNLWLGLDGGGLQRIDTNGVISKFGYFDGEGYLFDDKFMSMSNDADGNIWISTYGGGIYRYDWGTKVFQRFKKGSGPRFDLKDNSYRSIIVHDDELLIGGFWTGVERYDIETGRLLSHITQDSEQKLSLNVINCMMDTKEALYVGTCFGLNRYNHKDGSVSQFFVGNRDSDVNSFNSLAMDRSGGLWCSSKKGIFKLEDGKLLAFEKNNELPDLEISALQFDDNEDLWAASSAHLTRINISDNTILPFNIDESHSIFSFYVNSGFLDDKGDVYFGTNNGYITFSPSDFTINTTKPKAKLARFSTRNNEGESKDVWRSNKPNLAYADTIFIDYSQNNFSFEMVAMNYVGIENNQYAYRLKGYEVNWYNKGGARTGSYTNLPPGHYTLEMKAANNDGIWNESPQTVVIIISTPFWLTWWFRVLLLLAFVSVMWLLIRWKLSSVKRANVILEHKVAARTSELRTKNAEIQEAHRHITASIDYASLIQQSLLGSDQEVVKAFSSSGFIFFSPRDVVSGDFYWHYKSDKEELLIAADCTGHGVPGAFMTVLGKDILDQYVQFAKEIKALELIEFLDLQVSKKLGTKQGASFSADGMDLVLIHNKFSEERIEFCGLKNPLYVVNDGVIHQERGGKFPIGGRYENEKVFDSSFIEKKKGMTIYLCSDGYQDQFSSSGNKYMKKHFRETLLEASFLPILGQKEYLQKDITDWRDGEQQTDDILIIGLKFD